jgi:haloalkane dehalogenase
VEEEAMSQELFELAPGIREKWPFAARHARVNGWRMHYVDEGAGDPVLLCTATPPGAFFTGR